MKQLSSLAKCGGVFLLPDASETQVACIDLLFEQEGGLFLYDRLLQRPVILESIEDIPVLLAAFAERAKRIQKKGEGKPREEPEQQSLW